MKMKYIKTEWPDGIQFHKFFSDAVAASKQYECSIVFECKSEEGRKSICAVLPGGTHYVMAECTGRHTLQETLEFIENVYIVEIENTSSKPAMRVVPIIKEDKEVSKNTPTSPPNNET